MAVQTRPCHQCPHPCIVLHEVGQAGPGVCQAQCDGQVDAEEPHITRESVQYAAYQRLLAGHACQLSVGTVIPVGPYQQQHAYEVYLPTGEVEEVAGRRSYGDAGKRYGYGMHAQTAE